MYFYFSYSHRCSSCYSPLLAVLFFLSFSSAEAKTVVLRHSKGNFLIKGDLVKFDGDKFIVQSSRFGRMTINSKNFKCIEGPCPQKTGAIPAPKKLQTIFISGSNIIGADLMPSLVEAYAKTLNAKTKRVYTSQSQHLKMELRAKAGKKVFDINLYSKGSDTAFPALSNGQADIGMSSRQIRQKEIAMIKKSGMPKATQPYHERILALDGLQIILSPKNKINALSIKQIARIYSGKISNWSQLGGKPGKIDIYIRGDNSGTYSVFKKKVLAPYKLDVSSKARKFLSHEELSDAVARNPNSIGFTGIAYVRNAKTIAISTSCSAPRFPTSFDIKTEEYPLSYRLFLYTAKKYKNTHINKFLKYASSRSAQKIIEKNGFINQATEFMPFSRQADRIVTGIAASQEHSNTKLINEFSREFSNADRLSITFRFQPHSSRLESKSRGDIKELAKLLTSKKFRNRNVFLVGFTDSKSPTDKSIMLSVNRADKVKLAILAAGRGKIAPYRIRVRGYGKLLPVACNNTPSGRQKNYRVEVWMKRSS